MSRKVLSRSNTPVYFSGVSGRKIKSFITLERCDFVYSTISDQTTLVFLEWTQAKTKILQVFKPQKHKNNFKHQESVILKILHPQIINNAV